MANENDKKTEAPEVKKPIIKNNTLMVIIIAVGVIAAGAIFVMNMLKANKDKVSDNPATVEMHRVADYVTDMIKSGNLEIIYKDTSKRKGFYIAGAECYYTILHNGNILYVGQGTYTQSATTDDLKKSESRSSSDSSAKIFSEYVTGFSVDGYNQGNDTWPDGKVKITIRVEKDGKSDYTDLEIPIPTAGN